MKYDQLNFGSDWVKPMLLSSKQSKFETLTVPSNFLPSHKVYSRKDCKSGFDKVKHNQLLCKHSYLLIFFHKFEMYEEDFLFFIVANYHTFIVLLRSSTLCDLLGVEVMLISKLIVHYPFPLASFSDSAPAEIFSFSGFAFF